ncbi:hypothetical protein AM586_28120 [Massilia sp. WG5]|nr:hypothetical protein AM586_28120 [Massilia sp. WG5]
MGRIVLVGRVPLHALDDPRDGHRRIEQAHRIVARQLQRQLVLQRGDAPGADHELGQQVEGGAHDFDAPVQAYALEEHFFGGELLVRTEGRGDVAETQVVILAQRCTDFGVAVPDDAAEVVREQHFGRVAARQVTLRHQQDVDLATLHLGQGALVRLQEFQRHEGRRLAHLRRQLGQHHRADEVRGDDAEMPAACLGLEFHRRFHGLLDPQENVAHRLHQRQRQRRRHHLAAGLHQQLVAEILAQPRQDPARGRLAQAQAPRRAGDAAFGQQHVQADQQIQVEAVEPHALDVHAVDAQDNSIPAPCTRAWASTFAPAIASQNSRINWPMRRSGS